MSKTLTQKQFIDESIHRQIQVSRYITGQVNKIKSMILQLNREIAIYCSKTELLETKKQHNSLRSFVRAKCMYYRMITYSYLQNEINKFIKEQAAWLYDNYPIQLDEMDNDKINKNVMFESFSNTDTVKSYIKRIYDQVFQLWDSQLRIAYHVKNNMKNVVEIIMGEFKAYE